MNTSSSLKNKKIILGITGCIAAYKSAELLRLLKKAGADVWVVMTRSAREFITPLIMRTLSENPCITEMFDEKLSSMPLPHISLSKGADLLLIAPATANIIGKAVSGIGDDILSTIIMSCDCPKIFAPAMNTKMWCNKTVKENIEKLKRSGIKIIDPGKGELACGDTGEGRLAEADEIFKIVCDRIGTKQDLAGKKILITAGGTREAIDPVRFIGNNSSGKMGYALGQAAADRGADVTLISMPVSLDIPKGTAVHCVKSAQELKAEVEKEYDKNDVLIMAAAVADYKPVKVSSKKIKKNEKKRSLELEPTDDILSGLANKKGKKIIVGFALESEDLVANAKKKLKEKKLDLIVANGPSAFGSDESQVVLISKNGNVNELPRQKKVITANRILDLLAARVK